MAASNPSFSVPAGACDCHIHVYESGWPLAPSATFVPPPAPAQAYLEVRRALGLSRVVVVQPTGYGFDNGCTLAALAQLGDSARGVVVVDPSVDDATLARLHTAGARGVRFMMLPGGVLPWEALEPLAARIRPLGWHINLQIDGNGFAQLEERLARLDLALVVDHVGRFMPPPSTRAPAFRALRALMDRGRCWVKLSAPYESSVTGGPGYEDVGVLAAELAQDYPERCLWASNWPHPNRTPPPDNQHLMNLLAEWAPDPAVRQRILVDNPRELYGF